MTGFGPTLASSIAGAPQAERQQVLRTNREARDRARARESQRDEADAPLDKVELTEAVRNLKDNSQEETRDDREQHAPYSSAGRPVRRADDRQRLDLEG